MSQQCSWPTHSWPLEGRCPYYALLGLTQAPGFAGGPDWNLILSHLCTGYHGRRLRTPGRSANRGQATFLDVNC